jgi:hypothetical protein
VGLIYVAAFQLDVGETLLSAVGGVIPDWWDIHEEEGYLDALHPEDVFWGDLTPHATRKAVAQAGHLGLETVRQPLTRAAWRSVPSTYVITEKDNAFPVLAQEATAKRAQRVLRIILPLAFPVPAGKHGSIDPPGAAGFRRSAGCC